MSKVKIELTSEQREQLRHETGEDFETFTYEVLESRDAPKVGGNVDFTRVGEGRLYRGGGDRFVRVDPS